LKFRRILGLISSIIIFKVSLIWWMHIWGPLMNLKLLVDFDLLLNTFMWISLFKLQIVLDLLRRKRHRLCLLMCFKGCFFVFGLIKYYVTWMWKLFFMVLGVFCVWVVCYFFFFFFVWRRENKRDKTRILTNR
jgi:hypothetical protein